MKKVLFFFLISVSVFSQTGIGTTTPDASAKLEVSATNKGFLPPRVALTATNSASPITSPANGLMVFNTATTGVSPTNVLPGYYYWDGTGQQWVSLSTTVGNVMNQAIYRSTANTSTNSNVTWSNRFNNIAPGDLVVTNNQEFQLSNGFYKIEWGLPYQSANTYNSMQLQEYSSSVWGLFNGGAAYATVANGGNTDWGGATYSVDAVDCSTSSRKFRLVNNDGASRVLFAGATFIITKLNPAITTSTTADNLGNHIATSNIQLNGKYLSGDGGNEGIRIDNSGNVGLGTTTPSTSLHIENVNTFGSDPSVTSSPSIYIYNNNNASASAHSSLAIRTNGSGGGNPYLSFDIKGVSGYSMGLDNADGDKFKIFNNWNLNNSVTPAITITSDNKVGIGTTSPSVPLHVASSVVQYINTYGYLSQTGTGGSYTANTNISYSIQADQRIRAPEFNAISDVRIKKGITSLNTTNQLSDLNRLRVVNYAYIDQLANGNKTKTGFVAQEVERVNDQFVNQSTDFIPSVFALAKSVSLQEDALKISTEKPHDFAKGDVVKFFAEGKKEIILTIESITDSQTFTVKGWTEATDNVFIYGKKISDFRAIDFDQITALSVAAIQELSKQMEMLKLENTKLELNQRKLDQRLKKLESKIK